MSIKYRGLLQKMLTQFRGILILWGIVLCCNYGFICAENVVKLGEYGSGGFSKVAVKDNFAYCLSNEVGLLIFDISDETAPALVSTLQLPAPPVDICVAKNHLYIAAGSKGLQVIDVSMPSNPSISGYFLTVAEAKKVAAWGNHAILVEGDRLHIIDVPESGAPTQKGVYEREVEYSTGISDISVSGNKVYMAAEGKLEIIDISNPEVPTKLGEYRRLGYGYTHVSVTGNYACLGILWNGIEVLDISNPSEPIAVALWDKYVQTLYDLHADGDSLYVLTHYAYATITTQGSWTSLKHFDISDKTKLNSKGEHYMDGRISNAYINGNRTYLVSPNKFQITKTGKFTPMGEFSAIPTDDIEMNGNYAYVLSSGGAITIMDISSAGSPVPLDTISGSFSLIRMKEQYLYTINSNFFQVYILSNPKKPVLIAEYKNIQTSQFILKGNTVYLRTNEGFHIVDISSPASPVFVGSYQNQVNSFPSSGIAVLENYVYMQYYEDYGDFVDSDIHIVDISQPSQPVYLRKGDFDVYENPHALMNGNYGYTIRSKTLRVVDYTDPLKPVLLKTVTLPGIIYNFYIKANNIYTIYRPEGGHCRTIIVFDLADPSNPVPTDDYEMDVEVNTAVCIENKIYAGSKANFYIYQKINKQTDSWIELSRQRLNFAAQPKMGSTVAQSITLNTKGVGEWSVSADNPWVTITPDSGTSSTSLSVSVNVSGLDAGNYSAVITVTAPQAVNSPKTIDVLLTVQDESQGNIPFGEFSTPGEGSTVYGSVPVTGWALDDIGVTSVQIFRRTHRGVRVYIGDAVFVEGSRPDVEMAYPGFPMNYRAGWGYMLLTNFLPDSGNGTFTLEAMATDSEGNQVSLGTKTITCDNANSAKPFGAIDSPAQGGTASGAEYVNFGWALTPQPNTIPSDGSTITVWVDGVPMGNPVYNQYRDDIATLFPGYNNSQGAVGYFYLDTTQLSNGVHTIQWSVADDTGNSEGIGSRYFTVQNTESSKITQSVGLADIRDIPVDRQTPLGVITGYNIGESPVLQEKGKAGRIRIPETGRVEIHLNPAGGTPLGGYSGYQLVGEGLRRLPIGSYLDKHEGKFYWQPPSGYLGDFHFIFLKEGGLRIDVMVSVTSKGKLAPLPN